MDIKITQTDGGKTAEGFTHEWNDCGVRSLAIGANISYATAHDLLKREGRRDRKGTKLPWLTAALQKAGVGFSPVTEIGCTLVDFLRRNRTGRFIVITNRHGLAVIDGVVHDAGQISGARSRVRNAFRVILPAPVETKQAPPCTPAQVSELWARLDALEARQ